MNESRKPETRQIRIFLSSTFADMQPEREYLVKKIFPDIRRACQSRGIDLAILDLRWGITEEASRAGRVVEICMREIETCHPFFIGLVGGRYGWQPTHQDATLSHEFLESHPKIAQYMKQGLSVTEMEMQEGVLATDSPVDAFFYIRNPKHVPKQWREEPNSEAAQKLDKLKATIVDNASRGRCQATQYTTVKDLGKKVHQQIMEMVDRLYPANEEPTPQSQAATWHAQRLDTLRRGFVKRNLTGIDQVAEMSYSGPTPPSRLVCIIAGAEGVGKSRLLANIFHNDYFSKKAALIYTHVDAWAPTPQEQLNLVRYHLMRWKRHPKNIGLHYYWLIDGVENFENPAWRSLNWVACVADSFAGVMATANTAEADDALHTLSAMYGATGREVVSLRINVPQYSPEEVGKVADVYLRQHSKQLAPNQLKRIVEAPLMREPKLLNLVLGELQQFGVYERLDAFLNNYLSAPDEEALIGRIVQRIANDYGHEVLTDALQLFAMARFGLGDIAVMDALPLPHVESAGMLAALMPLLTPHLDRFTITSATLIDIIDHQYSIDKKRETRLRNVILADSTQRRKALMPKMMPKSWRERITYKFYGVLPDTANYNQAYGESLGEMFTQLVMTERLGEAFKLVSHTDLLEWANTCMIIITHWPKFHEAGYHAADLYNSRQLADDNSASLMYTLALISGESEVVLLAKKIKGMAMPQENKDETLKTMNVLEAQIELLPLLRMKAKSGFLANPKDKLAMEKCIIQPLFMLEPEDITECIAHIDAWLGHLKNDGYDGLLVFLLQTKLACQARLNNRKGYELTQQRLLQLHSIESQSSLFIRMYAGRNDPNVYFRFVDDIKRYNLGIDGEIYIAWAFGLIYCCVYENDDDTEKNYREHCLKRLVKIGKEIGNTPGPLIDMGHLMPASKWGVMALQEALSAFSLNDFRMVQVHTLLGRWLYAIGQPEEACQHLRIALETRRRHPADANMYASVEYIAFLLKHIES